MAGMRERLVAGCVGIFIGALSLYAAVALLRVIWLELVIIGLCVAGVAALIDLWRSRW